MDALPTNPFDLTVVAVVLLSALMGLFRGVVREVLKLVAWIGAGAAAMYGFALARPYARDFIPVETIADAVTGIGLFLVALVLLSLVANFVAEFASGGGLGVLDRTLGVVFGVLRGAVIVSLCYLLLTWTIKSERLPDWIIAARSRPLVEQGAALLAQLAPANLRLEATAAAAAAERRARQIIEAERKMRALSEPPAAGGAENKRKDYGERERKELDSLIRNKQ